MEGMTNEWTELPFRCPILKHLLHTLVSLLKSSTRTFDVDLHFFQGRIKMTGLPNIMSKNEKPLFHKIREHVAESYSSTEKQGFIAQLQKQ